jgi:hypothetical protein
VYEVYKPDARTRLRDARRQNGLASRLRAMPEPRAFRYIRRLMTVEPDVALQLAKRLLRSRPHLEALFVEALRESNESTVRSPIKHLWRRLGAARTLGLISAESAADPAIGRRAAYWLAAELDMDDPATAEEVGRLGRGRRHPAKRPVV